MKKTVLSSVIVGALFMFVFRAVGDSPELGTVKWGRDFEVALAESKKSGKPVFALFQEVPGCAGCQEFGREVLSQPQIVSAIESAFVPVAIFNNRPGKDAVVLKRYKEPAWNYQVIRFLDAEGKDIIPRKDRVWTTKGVAGRMVKVLEKDGHTVPDSLKALSSGKRTKAAATSGQQDAVFAMYCFWEGEARLGKLPGVVSTEAGWLGGSEVVKVTYDPAGIQLTTLVREAEKLDCARKIHVADQKAAQVAETVAKRPVKVGLGGYRPAAAKDQKYYLSRSKWKQLDLDPTQKTKLNAAIRFRADKGQIAKIIKNS